MQKLFIFLALIFCFEACNNKGDKIVYINQCYNKSLKELKKSKVYQRVISNFEDTFKVMVMDIRNFGDPRYVENKLDEFVFFNADKSMCLVLVLQKMKTSVSFGKCRVVYGFKNKTDKWSFDIRREILLDKSYFELYSENTFENISKLARYNIWIQGSTTEANCNINEKYWFNVE